MKVIGLIGGMSWESTIPYYRIINETVKERLGGLHSAKIILYSVDFYEIEQLQRAGDWAIAEEILGEAACALRSAGADFIVICTNTMHIVADTVQKQAGIPLLHIVDSCAQKIKRQGLKRVGLLGTSFTMEQEFYRGRMLTHHGIETVIPDASDRKVVHNVIFMELCLGIINEASRLQYRRIIKQLIKKGAEGIVLGCTELPMLIAAHDAPVPLFDTARIHAREAAEWAVSGVPAS